MQGDFVPNNLHKLTLLVGVCSAFLVGYLLPRPCKVQSSEFSLVNSSLEDDVSAPIASSKLEIADISKIASYGSERYSCNTEFASDELTRLHRNSEKLQTHASKGDANRARTATIARKAAQAASAEAAFRICVKGMVPELLNEWDNRLKNHGSTSIIWDERSEIKVGGITLDVLESTADEIITSQQSM